MTAAEREALISRYEAGPRVLREALAKVPAEAIKWRPAPGKWSVHEVVVHCADSETTSAVRIRFLVGEDRPTLSGYDQDRWAATFDYHALPMAPSLAQIDAVRAWTTALIRSLPESAWAREGTHSEMGRYTAEQWLEIYAEHLEVHARQIARNMEAWKTKR